MSVQKQDAVAGSGAANAGGASAADEVGVSSFGGTGYHSGSLVSRICAGSFGGHLTLTLGTNVFMACVGLATGILAARLLGPRGRGELAAIQTWPTSIAYLAMLGLADATVYFSAREPHRSGRYLSSAATLALLSGLPIGAAACFLMPHLLAAQAPVVIEAARWYLLMIPLAAVEVMPLNALRGRRNLVVWNALRATPNVGWLVVLVAAPALGKATPEWLAGAFLAMLGLLLFPVLLVTRRHVPGPFAPDRRLWRPMLGYGLPSAGASVPQLFNLRLDQMLMAALLAPRLLGLYVVAVAWSGAAAPATSAIGAVIFPHVASKCSPSLQAETLGRATRLGSVVAAGLCGILLVLTPLAVPLLFGARFAAAIPAALVLVVAGAVLGLISILEEGSRGLGDTKAILWSELGGLAVTAVALVLLLHPLGIMGAAIASLLAYGAIAVSLVVHIRYRTGYPATSLLLPHAEDFALARRRILAIMRG